MPHPQPPPPLGPGEDTSRVRVLAPRDPGPGLLAAGAILVALICGGPHLVMAARLAGQGLAYAPLVVGPVSPLTFDEATFYAPRLREVLDGHLFSADPTGWEHKARTPYLGGSWLDSVLTGALAALLGRSVPLAFVVCDFVLPPLSFLIVAAICLRLGATLWVALAAALAAVLAPDQAILPFSFGAQPTLGLLVERLHLVAADRPLECCRLCVPQAAFIPAGLTILGLVTLWEHPRLRGAILTGLALGATFYCYVFYWTWLVAAGVLLALAARLHPAHRRAAGAIAIALAVGLLIGLPVIYQTLAPDGFAGKAAISVRQSFGGLVTNWVNHRADLLLLVLLLALYPRRRPEYIPLAAFLIGPYVALLTAAVGGRGVQDWHWLGRCWQPWSALMLTLLLGVGITLATACRPLPPVDPGALAAMLRRLRQQRIIAGVFASVCAVIVVYAVQTQLRYAITMAPHHALPADHRAALEQLRLRAPTDSVVLALDPSVLALVPALTGCNDYLPHGILSPAPAEELAERCALAMAAYGVPVSRLAPALSSDPGGSYREGVFGALRHDLANWLFHRTLASGGVPPARLRELRARRGSHGPDSYRHLRARYRVDLVWWGPFERSTGDAALEARLAPYLFIEAGDVRIYRLPAALPVTAPATTPAR